MLLKVVLSALAVSSAEGACNKDYDSTDLSSAVDAALMELQATSGWFYDLGARFGHSYLQINSCTADPTKWDYPDALTATGLLKRVLASGELKVAGTPWSAGLTNYCAPDATSCFGSAANGVQNPTGYWVDMLADIAYQLSQHYGQTITVKRVYYDTSDLVNDAVANSPEDVDMSEPYYYLGGFLNSEPRFEYFHFSCVTAAASSEFFALKDSGISSTADLVDAIANAEAVAGRTMGFIGAGNYDAVSSILPSNVNANFDMGEFDDIVSAVAAGSFIAGYRSEGVALNESLFSVFDTGIISPRAILYRLDEECECEAKAALPAPPPPSEANAASPPPPEAESTTTPLIIAVIVVGAVALVLALLLALLIVKERAGVPVFMPIPGSKAPPAVGMGTV